MKEDDFNLLKNMSLKARLLSVILCSYMDAKEKDGTMIGKAELQFLKDLPKRIDQAIYLETVVD